MGLGSVYLLLYLRVASTFLEEFFFFFLKRTTTGWRYAGLKGCVEAHDFLFASTRMGCGWMNGCN